jgi:hypothetical protein
VTIERQGEHTVINIDGSATRAIHLYAKTP